MHVRYSRVSAVEAEVTVELSSEEVEEILYESATPASADGLDAAEELVCATLPKVLAERDVIAVSTAVGIV